MQAGASTIATGSLAFTPDGAERFAGAATGALADIARAIAHLPPDRAGIRLHDIAELRGILSTSGPVGAVAADVLGSGSRAVRAILFDKNPAANWSLAWHQDRTIVVRERREVDGFGPWTTKSGLLHVSPPFDLLAGMVTLRVHLDPVTAMNAPLLVAPGSHRCGRVAEDDITAVVEGCGVAACLADVGDIWLYATPILHASEAAKEPKRRRVLQVDFANCDLPGGLQWLGV